MDFQTFKPIDSKPDDSYLYGIDKARIVIEVEAIKIKYGITNIEACQEMNISPRAFYNYKRKRKEAGGNFEQWIKLLNDGRLKKAYKPSQEYLKYAKTLCQLFPFLGFRSLTKIVNETNSLIGKKATESEMYSFLDLWGLTTEEERMEYARRMNCQNKSCKTDYDFAPKSRLERKRIIEWYIKNSNSKDISSFIDVDKKEFKIGHCQNKGNCLSKALYLEDLKSFHFFANDNEFLRRKFKLWVSRKTPLERKKMKKEYPDLLKDLDI